MTMNTIATPTLADRLERPAAKALIAELTRALKTGAKAVERVEELRAQIRQSEAQAQHNAEVARDIAHALDDLDIETCPICLTPFQPADPCLSDVDMGTCHAACLEGSGRVDAEGEPLPDDAPLPEPYRYDSLTQARPMPHPDQNSGASREPMTHDLKTWPEPFKALKTGLKSWEFRRADRDYRDGDLLLLREWHEDDGYTGDQIVRQVTWSLFGGTFGIPDDHIIMSLASDSDEAAYKRGWNDRESDFVERAASILPASDCGLVDGLAKALEPFAAHHVMYLADTPPATLIPITVEYRSLVRAVEALTHARTGDN